MRRLWVDGDTGDYLRERLKFPGATLAFRLDREMRDEDDTQVLFETRYFVTNLDPGSVTADDLLRYARGHWQVENSLHFVKDRWWDEDRHYSKRPGVALGFAVLLNAVVTVLRASGAAGDDRPLRARADALAWDVGQAIALIARTMF